MNESKSTNMDDDEPNDIELPADAQNEEEGVDDNVPVLEDSDNENDSHEDDRDEKDADDSYGGAQSDFEEAFGVVEIETALRKKLSGPPVGIRRADHAGLEVYDASSGRASVFGFGFNPITEAIQAAAENYLGDGGSSDDEPSGDDGLLREVLQEFAGEAMEIDSIFLRPSADEAMETAIRLARKFRASCYRTIALVGSDHGRTGLCRTASGCPELHQGFGPMMAGFTHVQAGDLKAIREAVDDQTCCVLLSPIDLLDAARAVDAEYLQGVREICDEHGLLLIIDESRLTFGGSGGAFTYATIANVQADMIVVAGGLFGGLAGGLVLATEHVAGQSILDANRHPLLSAVAIETLSSMKRQGLPASAKETMRGFAIALAGQLGGFEFVRDVNVLGNTIGIEFDIESLAVVRAAARNAIRIEVAGETSVRLQLPLIFGDDDQNILLTRLAATMEIIEREAAELTV